MKANVILTSDQKPYMSRLIYSKEQTTTDRGEQEEWKTKEEKRICSEVSVNSPGNPRSQPRRRKGRLWWERFVEKESFKPGVEEWRGDGLWEWWVNGGDGGNATQRNGWGRIGEISAGLTEGGRDEGKHTGRNDLLFVKKMLLVDEREWPKMKSVCCEEAELWRGCTDKDT